MPNFIDIFCGCGGLSLGFKLEGFNSLLANDIDENCAATYTHNFPNTNFICGDISKLSNEDIKKKVNGVSPDLIIGGPPCQGFSLANKNRNKIQDDPRNKLFYDFVRLVQFFQPKVFLMENVKGLISMKGGKVIDTIIEEFSNCGYKVDYQILNSADYGVPQLRERVFIMGVRNDFKKSPSFPIPCLLKEKYIGVWDAINDLPQISAGEGMDKSNYGTSPKNSYQMLMRKANDKTVYNHISMKHTKRLIERFKNIGFGQSVKDVSEEHSAVKRGDPSKKSGKVFSQNNKRVFPEKPSPTIAASFQSNFIHPFLNRNFTAREGARLQSFPDDYIFKGFRTKMSWEKGLSQYQQIGNAVPPLLSKALAKHIKEHILGH